MIGEPTPNKTVVTEDKGYQAALEWLQNTVDSIETDINSLEATLMEKQNVDTVKLEILHSLRPLKESIKTVLTEAKKNTDNLAKSANHIFYETYIALDDFLKERPSNQPNQNPNNDKGGTFFSFRSLPYVTTIFSNPKNMFEEHRDALKKDLNFDARDTMENLRLRIIDIANQLDPKLKSIILPENSNMDGHFIGDILDLYAPVPRNQSIIDAVENNLIKNSEELEGNVKDMYHLCKLIGFINECIKFLDDPRIKFLTEKNNEDFDPNDFILLLSSQKATFEGLFDEAKTQHLEPLRASYGDETINKLSNDFDETKRSLLAIYDHAIDDANNLNCSATESVPKFK